VSFDEQIKEFERQRQAARLRDMSAEQSLIASRQTAMAQAHALLDDALELCRSRGFGLNPYYTQHYTLTASRGLSSHVRFDFADGISSQGWVVGDTVLTQQGQMLFGHNVYPREARRGRWSKGVPSGIRELLCVCESSEAAGERKFAPPHDGTFAYPDTFRSISWQDSTSASLVVSGRSIRSQDSFGGAPKSITKVVNDLVLALYVRMNP